MGPTAQLNMTEHAQESSGPAQAAICQLVHSLKVGGAEVLAARLARRLSGTYRFLFACLDELGSLGEELRAEGFAVHVLDRRPGLDWRCSYRLARLLRRERVDVLHAHQYTPFFYGLVARLLSRRPAILFMEHGRHYPDYPRRKRMLVNRLLLERRDRVVGVGQAVRQALLDNEGFPAERVKVIYNGVDLAPIARGAAARAAARAQLGLDENDLVLLMVARLDYLKDHATALRTLKQVVPHRPNARLVLVGEGPERPKIEQHIQEKSLHAHVRLLGQRGDVARLLTGADIFLLTSISEGIPLTLIEAMAAELPIVSTRVGGVAEVVEHERTGLLAPAGDHMKLAEYVLRLGTDESLRCLLGRQGCERAWATFTEKQMHAGYVQLYQEMLRA